MFLEALGIDELTQIDNLEKEYMFHFVLQHPENQMVMRVDSPKVYLVDISVLEEEENTKERFVTFLSRDHFLQPMAASSLNVYFPKRVFIGNGDTIEDVVSRHLTIQTPSSVMGLMIKNTKTGNRAVSLNPAFEEYKRIRGNFPNLQYQYLCLRRTNQVLDFLRHFPQYKKIFYDYKEQYIMFAKNLHQTYFDYYVTKKIKEVSPKYFYYINQIHYTIYIPSLQRQTTDDEKNVKTVVKLSVVIDYMNSLDPGHLLHLMNYERMK